MADALVTPDDVVTAYARIRDRIRRTPVIDVGAAELGVPVPVTLPATEPSPTPERQLVLTLDTADPGRTVPFEGGNVLKNDGSVVWTDASETHFRYAWSIASFYF